MRYWKRCLLLLVGVFMGLVLVEVLARCFHLFPPPMLLGKEDTPRQSTPYSRRWQSHFAEENRMWADKGIALRELGYATPYHLRNVTQGIVVLGDSFTAGIGVREEEGYVDLLRAARAPLTVVNLGAEGSGLDNMNYQLRNFIDALKPRLVVCAVYADDLRRHQPDWLLIRNRPVATLKEGKVTYTRASEALRHPFLYHHSRTYQIYNYAFRKRYEEWSSNFLTFGRSYRLNEALLREMKSACERNKSQLVVIYIPSRKQLEKGALVLKWTRPRSLDQVRRQIKQGNMLKTADLQPKPSEYYRAGDIHLNPEGHRLVFNRLTQFIQDQRLLAEPLK